MYSFKELFIKTCLTEFNWLVRGIRFEILCINPGKTETGYIIPEKIDIKIFIRKFIGSACLKYKTNDKAKNDNAKKGIIINKIKKNAVKTENARKI